VLPFYTTVCNTTFLYSRAQLTELSTKPRQRVYKVNRRNLGLSYHRARIAFNEMHESTLQSTGVGNRSLRFLVALSLLGTTLVPNTRCHPQKQDIFLHAPFHSCHASTIVQLRNGDFLAAWFGGSTEGKPDVAIWGARRHEGHWGAPTELVRERQIATWNPVLFYSASGRLWLYYKFGPSPSTWSAGRMYSDDDGNTWSTVQHMPAGLYGPARAKPLVLRDGTIVSGTSVESYGSWAAWVERSTDDGMTWSKAGPITVVNLSKALKAEQSTGIIQPSVISLEEKHLRFYARSTLDIAKICVSDSFDNGITWNPAQPIAIPNPNSGIDAVRLRDGRIILAYNNTTTGRTPLNLAVSHDGEHFALFQTLEDQPGEYSYPAIIQGQDGDLYMTYTWNRKTIRFTRIPIVEIPK
jgi:predicted neuraminidase